MWIYDREVGSWRTAYVAGERVTRFEVLKASWLDADVADLQGLTHPGLLRIRSRRGPVLDLDGFEGTTLRRVWPHLDLLPGEQEAVAAHLVGRLAEAAGELVERGLGLHLMSGTVVVTTTGDVRLVPPFHHYLAGAVPSFAQHPMAYELGFCPLDEDVTAASTIFHLGTVLHGLATQGPPWRAMMPMYRQRRDPSPIGDWLDPSAWLARARAHEGSLACIVRRCLAPTPSERFESVAALAEALSAWNTQLPRERLAAAVVPD